MGESTPQTHKGQTTITDAEAVRRTAESCLLTKEELSEIPEEVISRLRRTYNPDAIATVKKYGGIVVVGATSKVIFNRDRLEQTRDFVIRCLDQIPFRKPSHWQKYPYTHFAGLVRDKNDPLWEASRAADSLVCLGIGLGLLKLSCLGNDVYDMIIQYNREGKMPE